MEEELISKEEACAMLNVKLRTLYKYLERGYLRKVNKKNRLFLVKKDVETLIVALKDPINVADKILISKLYAQIREQENDLNIIKRIMNLYYEPLELEDFSITALYRAAERLEISDWEDGWEDEWGTLILRMREEDLFQLEKITGDEHPWKPFYKLLLVTQEIFRKRGDYTYAEQYNAAREHLKKLITIWCEIKNKPKALEHLPKEEFGKWVVTRLRERYKK